MKGEHPVEGLCELLQVSRSGYYRWRRARPSRRATQDAALSEHIVRLSRRHGELTSLLTDQYAGVLQSDSYGAYAAYARSHPAVAWVGCWAHARRRFFEAQDE